MWGGPFHSMLCNAVQERECWGVISVHLSVQYARISIQDGYMYIQGTAALKPSGRLTAPAAMCLIVIAMCCLRAKL
jgi:hypothetical protein